MAAEFQGTQTTLQPTALEQPISTNVFDQAASVFGQASADSVQQANVQGARVAPLAAQASASFEKAYAVYNKYAEQKAAEDAPAAIKFDGDHNIIPPTSFYPPGISSTAYAESYKATSKALYTSYAEQELNNYSGLMREKYAADPAGYAAAMATKQKAMAQNLSADVAPWIDVRGQQITSQGLTQLAVANQSVKNAVAKEDAARQLAGIKEDGSRLLASTPQAQGGGGSLAGYDNNIGNVVNTADQYAGGKGLPYIASGNPLKFETFETAEHGVAASYQLIKKKVQGSGLPMTFAGLVSSWDPKASPEIKANYAGALAKAAGLEVGDEVPIGDDAKMAGVLKAMNQFEKGKQTVGDAAFINGIKLANGDVTVPRTQSVASAAPLSDPKTLADAANLAINSAALAKRVEGYEITAKAAGIDPAEIARNKQEMVIGVQLGAMAEQIKNSASQLYGSDGNVNQGAVATVQDRIREIAAKYPGREKQVTDTLNEALSFAQTQAGRRAAQIQVDDQRTANPIMRQMMADAAAAKAAALAGNSVAAKAITDRLESQGRSILNDTTLSDKVAMTLAQGAMTNGSISRGALQESYTNRLQSLTAIANDTNPLSSTPQMKAQAEAEMKAIKADPSLMRDLTAGQRSYLQSGLDLFATKRLGADTSGLVAAAALGDSGSPQAFAGVLQSRAAAGIDGNHPGAQLTLPQQAQLLATYTAAYNKKQTNQDLAVEGMRRAQAGQPVTADQQAAINATQAFKLPNEAFDPTDPAHGLVAGTPSNRPPETFNPAAPGHSAAAGEFQRKFGFMPPRVKDAFDAMPLSSNQATMQPWFDFYKQTYNIAAEKIFARTGQRPSDADLRAEVATMIPADKANLLAIGVRNGELGAETMYKTATNPKASVTANTGQPTGAASTTMDAATAEYTKTLTDNGAKSIPLNKLLDFRVPGTAGWQPTPAEITAQKAYSSGPQVAPGMVERVTGKPLFGTGMPTNVTMEGEADTLIKQRAGDLMAREGDVIRKGNNAGTPEGYAYSQVTNQMIDGGQLEMRRDPNDPNHGIIGLKSANKAFADKMGLDRFNDQTTNAIAEQLVRADATLGNKTLPDFDSKSLYVVPYVNEQGKSFWFIGANEKRTGQRLKLMDVSQDDPRFDAATMAMDRSAMITMQKNLVGEDGKPVDPHTAASYALSFSRVLQAPFESIMKQHYAEGSVLSPQDHQAFVDELNRRMTEIRTQQGLPSVDWKKSLDNIAKDPTPDDGRGGMLRDLARQESAKKESERTTRPAAPLPLPAR